MTKKNKILLSLLLASVVVIVIAAGITFSYLIDTDAVDNVITIGKVSLDIKEENYTANNSLIDVQQKISKDPCIENDGNKDEYVFMEILVPVDTVTLLYEETAGGHTEGQIKQNNANIELFKLIAKNPSGQNVVISSGHALENSDIVFSYHKADDETTAGWYQLGDPVVKTETSGGKTKTYHSYLFGYNGKLAPKAKTLTLFDEVQLKSFIDEELKGEYKIDIKAYGIQADLLDTAGITDETTSITKAQSEAVYRIITNKTEG